MYGWKNLRKDFNWIGAIGLVGPGLILAYFSMFAPRHTLSNIWNEAGFLFVAWLVGFFIVICAIVTAFRSLFFITNSGWKRIIILVAICVFMQPLVTMKWRYWETGNVEQITGAFGIGVLMAAATIALPQIVYGLFRWIRNGFEEKTQEEIDENPSNMSRTLQE